MKIPSHLFKSRHGVYYYRLQYSVNSKRYERRISLKTKSPVFAKSLSVKISAIILQKQSQGYDMTKFLDPNDPNSWDDFLGTDSSKLRKFDIDLGNGVVIRNINSDDDVTRVGMLLKDQGFNKSIETIENSASKSENQDITKENFAGRTLDEMIALYATSRSEKVVSKTMYEYSNYQRKFSEFIHKRKNSKSYPIAKITQEDVAYYINHLQSITKSTKNKATGEVTTKRAISDRTIQFKYLASLGTLFELAQTFGSYPKGAESIPTRGHKVFTKRDLKSKKSSDNYHPFTDNELAKIFDCSTFKAQKRPVDFWLPLLGLFTGARISELCQLALNDILEIDNIWSISINDDDYKHLKSPAAKRIIPIHPKLIELGFIDYWMDAKEIDATLLFPYLKPDSYGDYSGTPGGRFGKYLDSLQITDRYKTFHSFRKTVNIMLQQKNITEEVRCGFMGHEYESTNSTVYGDDYKVSFFQKYVIPSIDYPGVSFQNLKYQRGDFMPKLTQLMKVKRSFQLNKFNKNVNRMKQQK